jgi:hypothetical protein
VIDDNPDTDASRVPAPKVRDEYGLARSKHGERVHIVRGGHRSLVQLDVHADGPYGLCRNLQTPSEAAPTADEFAEMPCRTCFVQALRLGLLDDWLPEEQGGVPA